MKLTFLGHAAVLLEHDGTSVLIDPFLTGNPKAAVDAASLSPQLIVLTHAHGDHVGDAVSIAKRSGATLVSNVEIIGKLATDGVAGVGANIGGPVSLPVAGVGLRFTPAWHSSSFADGGYGGLAMGAVLELGGLRVYHAGDTALFGDMAIIGRGGGSQQPGWLDVALLPIGGHYTMGPDDALEAVRLLAPKHVVPIHHSTMALIEQDGEAFKRRVEAVTDATVHPLAPGGVLEL